MTTTMTIRPRETTRVFQGTMCLYLAFRTVIPGGCRRKALETSMYLYSKYRNLSACRGAYSITCSSRER